MQQKVARLYEQCALKKRIEHYLQHWLTWVKGGLGEVIGPALKSIKKTIHNMCEAVDIAKRSRLSVDAFCELMS